MRTMNIKEEIGILQLLEDLNVEEGMPSIEARKRIIELLDGGILSFVNVIGLDYPGIVLTKDLRPARVSYACYQELNEGREKWQGLIGAD